MHKLETISYDTLANALDQIFQSNDSLVADSQIRNLNTGLCLVQCGLAHHPLVQTMALGKKRYVAYWSNDKDMEQLLQYWLQSEVLVATNSSSKYSPIIGMMSQFAANFFLELEEITELSIRESKSLPINWYTFIMGGHLLRNLNIIDPKSATIRRALKFALIMIANFANAQLRNGQTLFLDFCLSFFTGLESWFDEELHKLKDEVGERVNDLLNEEDYWNVENNSVIAHTLMDLHIADMLNKENWERGIEEVCNRIRKVLSEEPIDLQDLTRLTRTLGELSRDFENIV